MPKIVGFGGGQKGPKNHFYKTLKTSSKWTTEDPRKRAPMGPHFGGPEKGGQFAQFIKMVLAYFTLKNRFQGD